MEKEVHEKLADLEDERIIFGEDHSFDLKTKKYYYKYRRVDGKRLKDFKFGRRSEKSNCRLVIEILRLVSVLHSKGVVHQLLNPKNIMINDGKEVWIFNVGKGYSINFPDSQAVAQMID